MKKKLKNYLEIIIGVLLFSFIAVSVQGAYGDAKPSENLSEYTQPVTNKPTQEVVIDLAKGWPSVPGVYNNDGYYIWIYNPDYHYIIKNTAFQEVYIYFGAQSANTSKRVPGEYYATFQNADLHPWQWNSAPLNVEPGSTLNLNLEGINVISKGNDWVNSAALINVPTQSTLNISGTGKLYIYNVHPRITGAGIGTFGSEAFGNININSGIINVDVSDSKNYGIGGYSSGNITIGKDASVTVRGAKGKPAIGVGPNGSISIEDGAEIRALAKGANAIETSNSKGTAKIINAYYVGNGPRDTYLPIDAVNRKNINITPDSMSFQVVEGFTSFAYDRPQGNVPYKQSININGVDKELVSFDDNSRLSATTDLKAIPVSLYDGKMVTFDINYYFWSDSIFIGSKTSKSFAEGTVLDEAMIATYAGNDWKTAGIPEGYKVNDVTYTYSIDKINNKVNVIYQSSSYPYKINYYYDKINTSNLLGTELKYVTGNNYINSGTIAPFLNDYKASITSGNYKDGLWVDNNANALTELDLTWNPELNVLNVLYLKNNNPNEKFKVTFDSNGGSAVKSQEVVSGGLAKMPSVPTLKGNCFSGWYADKEFTQRWIFSKDKVYSDITLYGKWCY